MSNSLDAIVGSFPDLPDVDEMIDPFTARARRVDDVQARFAHVDRVLRECATADDLIYRTAAALWEAIAGPANKAITDADDRAARGQA